MSAELDPAKLKVVDLRTELSNRGLDTKGNKAALVKRLKDALEEELKKELPDTSIADTSTEDLDTSQTAEVTTPKKKEPIKPPEEKLKSPEKAKAAAESETPKPKTPEKPKGASKPEISKTPDKPKGSETDVPPEEKPEENAAEENGQEEAKSSRKSRWTEQETEEQDDKSSEEEHKEDDEQDENKGEEKQSDDIEMQEGDAPKGEKRKRDSSSPSRAQRRRSRSPIKEDEPTIDSDKVQLSWYDSDLHLQLDKGSFLSGKPLTEGAFGYMWSGVRATHGISSGKVCYEVKLTEELKFEDLQKSASRNERDKERYRTDHRREERGRDRRDRKDSSKKSDSDKQKSESGEEKNKSEKKDSTEEEKQDDAEGGKEDSTEEEKKDGAEGEKSEEKKGDEEKVEKMETDETKTEEKPAKGSDETKKSEDAETKPENAGESDKTEGSEEKQEKTEDDKEESEKMETEEAKPEEPPTEPIPERMFRVGFSLLSTGLQLGEEKFSFAYESSGKFATNKEFNDFGATFGNGDVVGAFLSIDSEEVSFRFTVNGQLQPETITVPRSEFPEENFALFPHVLSRNYAFELNLGNREEPWFPIPEELSEYQFLEKMEDKVVGPVRPETRADCEAILMIGLPSSGKTHWVNEFLQENPDKKYSVIGNSAMLDRMTVSGEPLKSRFKGRWHYLMDRLQYCLNKLTDMAALRRRNYIIDRPHVFPSQQRRKLRQFEGFKRRAIVVVVTDEEQAKREALVEDQSARDASHMLDMKATFGVPNKDDNFVEDITYAGVNEEEAKEIIKKYNTTGKEAGYGNRKPFNRRPYYNQPGNYRDRSYQRYDRRAAPPPGNWGRQDGGRGWNRDRRDARGPPPDRNWGRNGRGAGSRAPERSRDGGRSGDGGYNRSRQSGGSGSGRQGGGNWGGGNWGGQGGWQGYGGYGGQGQGGWGAQGQGGGNWKYGGQNQGGYGSGGGGGYGGNWNYYNQYAQSQQNWNQGQGVAAGWNWGGGGGGGGNQQNPANYTQQAWAQFAKQYAQQQQARQAGQHQTAPDRRN